MKLWPLLFRGATSFQPRRGAAACGRRAEKCAPKALPHGKHIRRSAAGSGERKWKWGSGVGGRMRGRGRARAAPQSARRAAWAGTRPVCVARRRRRRAGSGGAAEFCAAAAARGRPRSRYGVSHNAEGALWALCATASSADIISAVRSAKRGRSRGEGTWRGRSISDTLGGASGLEGLRTGRDAL